MSEDTKLTNDQTEHAIDLERVLNIMTIALTPLDATYWGPKEWLGRNGIAQQCSSAGTDTINCLCERLPCWAVERIQACVDELLDMNKLHKCYGENRIGLGTPETCILCKYLKKIQKEEK